MPRRRYDMHLAVLLGLMAVECVLFYTQVARQIAPFYPSRHDQLGYYNETFMLLTSFQIKGWRAFLSYLIHPPATGLMFVPQGTLLAIIGGGTRTAALSLNLVYFFALQVVLFQTMRARMRDVSLAWIAIALLLACGTIFQFAGGIYDYRIDFSVHCLYGIWLCLVIRSRAFRNTKLAIMVGLVGALIASMRYFAIIYLFGVYCVLLVAAVAVVLRSSGPIRKIALLRLRNLFISGAAIAIIVLPQFLLASGAIYKYYIVGHVLNEEKYIRAAEVGISSILGHVLYYPASLWFSHLGTSAYRIASELAIALVISSLLFRGASLSYRLRRARCFKFEFLVLSAAVVAPLLALSLDVAKSPVVGGIGIGPLLLLIVVLGAVITPRGEWRLSVPTGSFKLCCGHASLFFVALHRHLTPRRVMDVVCVLATVVALAAFVRHGIAKQHYMSYIDLRRVAELNRKIAYWIVDEGASDAVVSIDRVVDYLNQGSIWITAFEEFQQTIAVRPAFGHGPGGIFATPRNVAMSLIQGSDIIVLTDPKLGRDVPYPMNTKIREYWGEMRAWTIANRLPFYSTNILDIPHTVFVRPSVSIAGLSAGWIASGGVVIGSSAKDLSRWPFIVLEGAADYDVLGGVPHPKVVVIDASGKPGTTLDAKLTRNGNRYNLVIDTRPATLQQDGTLKVRLVFDRFFVPKALGISDDTRELVLMAPSRRSLIVSPPR